MITTNTASFWTSQYQLTYPVVVDPEGEVFKKFGIGSVPYHVLIDKDFRIYLSQEDFKKSHIIDMIQKMLEVPANLSLKAKFKKFLNWR